MIMNHVRTLVSAWKVKPYTQWQAADHRSIAYDKLAPQIAAACSHIVQDGPYKGMKYFGPEGVPLVDPTPTTKLLGSYEEEINPWIEQIIRSGTGTVVHIGAGAGYHPVGMLTRMPDANAIVFDTLIPARKAVKQLAKQNGVHERLQLRGFCGSQGMLEIDFSNTVVVSDCGGAELTILDPKSYPGLQSATILVETHDAFDNRITPRLRSRFSATHKIEFRHVVERDPSDYPVLIGFPGSSASLALDEKRQRTPDGKVQAWALLTPYCS
jgi:hypothetical protein